eukprot:TRINITY_DN60817_c0_g1_i1.p1 TRINITY_DN60817_c0_g1~~TRINITY_DN60817_c0_g1_i1.p1  ORF type:complete len:231 (+),score=60.62 TRINITY_DN60817_c0_g1_i1:83-694(+)
MSFRRSPRLLAPEGMVGRFMFNRKKLWDAQSRNDRIRNMVLGFIGIGGVGASFYKLYRLDSERRVEHHVGWRGEYAQDFTRPGQPPFNLNLPPHLRTDMKSYLDLPETIVKPPPAWSHLHPYLRDRFREIFLDPPDMPDEELELRQRHQWMATTPWGEVKGLDDIDPRVLRMMRSRIRREEATELPANAAEAPRPREAPPKAE